jgi:hypothetical protein
MSELKIYKSRWKAIKSMVIASPFVFGGLYFLDHSDVPRWLSLMSILFFGLAYPVAIYQLLDRRPQIIINEVGIFDRTCHKDFINWNLINNAYIVEVHGQHFISLIVDERFEPSKKGSRFRKQLASVSKCLGFQELNVSLGYVNVDAVKLNNLILAMISCNLGDRKDVLFKKLPDFH